MSRPARRTSRPALTGAQRRTRVRRAVALGGLLAAVGGLVTLRSAVSPAPSQALGASGLAAPVGTHATAGTHQRVTRHHGKHPSRRRVTGNAYDVGYGVVQVRVTLRGHRLTDVTALSLPQGGRSSDISSYAGPRLRQEALASQSARIDTVSGASYTSAGYARSLQSALDKGARG